MPEGRNLIFRDFVSNRVFDPKRNFLAVHGYFKSFYGGKEADFTYFADVKGFVCLSFLILLWGTHLLTAQEALTPRVHFLADSVKVGQPVQLLLQVDYPFSRRILLPDTNHNFAPFELQRKDYFSTRTRNGISRDCVLYTLATFQIEINQRIQLPVYEFDASDSIVHLSNQDSIFLIQKLAPKDLERPIFEADLTYQNVARPINYPYLLLGFGIVILLLVAINFFFNRPIQRFIYLIVENRRHKAFLKQFERIQSQMERNLTTKTMDQLLVAWRKYIQRVDGKPFTTFTTTEISQVLPDPALKNALSEIDRWIYGGIEMTDWKVQVESLKAISILMFFKKKDAIRSGKFE